MPRPARSYTHIDVPALLTAAQKIFMETPTNGACARAQGKGWAIVHPTSEDATHFDPYGAVVRACGGYGLSQRKVTRFMEKYGRTKYGKELRRFFDAKTTKPADVAGWFSEVIRAAEAKYPSRASEVKTAEPVA